MMADKLTFLQQTVNPAICDLLKNAYELKLVVDGTIVPLAVGPQSHSNNTEEIGLSKRNMFCLEDGAWHICFNGRSVAREAWDGWSYIHQLIKQPNVSIAAATLYARHKGENVEGKSEKQFEEEGYAEVGLRVESDTHEPVVPKDARRRVLNELREMQEELTFLRANGEDELALRKEEEIEKVREYLRGASYRGHLKKFGGPSENARKRVSIAIARAIADLEEEHPALARHLDNSIHTGKECRYVPDREVQWLL
jgi:hypothetical protein